MTRAAALKREAAQVHLDEAAACMAEIERLRAQCQEAQRRRDEALRKAHASGSGMSPPSIARALGLSPTMVRTVVVLNA